MSALFLGLVDQVIAYIAASTAELVVAGIFALVAAGWRQLVQARKERQDQKATAFRQLQDIVVGGADALITVILADPGAAAAIEAAKAKLTADIAGGSAGLLKVIGADAAGVERLLLRTAAGALPAAATAAASSAGRDALGTVQAASGALARVSGLLR